MHSPDGADAHAGAALHAQLVIDLMHLMRAHRDRVRRACLRAERAADALVTDLVADERLADARRTAALKVRHVLLPEVPQRSEHRVRRGAPERAEARIAHHRPQFLQPVEVRRLASARRDPLEDVQHPARADPAWHAAPA